AGDLPARVLAVHTAFFPCPGRRLGAMAVSAEKQDWMRSGSESVRVRHRMGAAVVRGPPARRVLTAELGILGNRPLPLLSRWTVAGCMGEQVAAVESKEEWVIRAPTVVAAAVE